MRRENLYFLVVGKKRSENITIISETESMTTTELQIRRI
jgi:hypothetical protein